MRAVVLPRPARLNELAGGNHRRVAANGDQIALTPRLHPQYAEPVLLVVEGDALRQATEDLGRVACPGWLPYGGDLILAPHTTHASREGLGGHYIAADDVGTTLADLVIMREVTRYTAAATTAAGRTCAQPLSLRNCATAAPATKIRYT